jgi:hypothetical protein|tara:strand:- start:3930 stop:5216 length:1287 start_codon:yes stop_codon:yes gene_type:complete
VLYSASNAKLKINGEEILASSAQLSLGAQLSPNYLAGNRDADVFTASNGIGGQLSFEYYLTGTDYFKGFITGQGGVNSMGVVLSGNFGGLNFDSGYLTSYTMNFGPNAPARATATVKFFDELQGEFQSVASAPPAGVDLLNFSNASISAEFEEGVVENFIGGTFNYSSDVSAAYLMNETKPSRVSFGVQSANINLEIDNPTGNLPVSGSTAEIEVALSRPNNQDVPVTSWTLRNSPYDKFSTFNTDGSSITSAVKTDTTNYGLADTSAFIINDGERLRVEFTLTLNSGSTPRIQLISNRLINDAGSAWSTSQNSPNGANSHLMLVRPLSDATIIGTGNYGMIQIYNEPSEVANWSLSDLKVTRVLTKPSDVFTCSGVMQSRNLASAAGDYIKQTINVIQSSSKVNRVFIKYIIDSAGANVGIGSSIEG